MPDAHANLAVSNVATAPSPASSGTSLVVTAGHGTRFPDPATFGPYNATIWPSGQLPTPANAEIVRVTAKSTDTLTITRTQESTSARTVVIGDVIAATITRKTLEDIEGSDAVPVAPNALDDEFNGSAIDAKWTLVNDPAGGDAFSVARYPGYLAVGLTELGTDNFANLLQAYQTAPTGTAVMTFTAKIALTITAADGLTDAAEFAGLGIALINSTNSEAVGTGVQLNDAVAADLDMVPLSALGFQEAFSGLGNSGAGRIIPLSAFIYLRLRKTTSAAYTSSNTYMWDYSLNGVIWNNIGQSAKVFTTACDRVGLMFRRPKTATATPQCEAIVDYFRRTA